MAVALSAALGLGRPAVLAGAGLAVVALIRTAFPAHLRPKRRLDVILVAAEVIAAVVAVTATKGWVSPFLFSLAATGVIVGYGFGLVRATLAATAAGLAVTALSAVTSSPATTDDAVLGWSQVLLVYLVAGYARRIFVEEAQRTSLALTRVGRLTEANDLLFELYRVAQSLPVSLELGDTLALVVGRVRELLQPDVVVVLLPDDGVATWSAAVAEGARFRGPVSPEQLPRPLRIAATQIDAHLEPELTAGAGLGLASRSGLYTSLRARGQLVGLLAVEKRDAYALSERDAQLLEGVGEQAALAIDNARLFRRLRTVGADQERTRIARDLHDRVGQSLAYLAFELDRLVGKVEAEPLKAELQGLRDDVRQAVSEVRETLYDLRTEVSEKVGLPEVLDDFVQRVRTRSGLAIKLRVDGATRLPLTQERELLRIAQEAVTNVERHAEASSVIVSLRLRPEEALLEVVDDGRGFVKGSSGRLDSYGLVGMRERADAIGAALDIDTAPGRGTTIRCSLLQPEHEGTPR
ncbi:MAG: GAF domain-containing sensor histidine kinase [Acidimicrobiales bacterium]